MKKIIFAAVLPALLIFTSAASAQKKNSDDMPELPTVSSVNVQRYSGKWYEIARYPNELQKKCVGNTTTTYATKTNGNLTIQNQCVLKNGTIGQANGEAKNLDTISNAKFEMNFPSRLKGIIPMAQRGGYWIIDLDSDYQFAAVSDPTRQTLWILSRTPEMKDAVYQNILRRVEKLGFAPGKLTKTPQNLEVIKGEIIQKQ